MKPILFSIFNYDVSSYFTFIFLAIIVSSILFLYLSRKHNFSLIHAIDILIIINLTWFVGARIFHIVFELPEFYIKNPIKIFYLHKGGFVIYGAYIISSLAVYIYCRLKKLNFFNLLDIASPAIALGSSIGRVGCLMQGCCYGKPSSLLWSIHIHDKDLHPTQGYMIVYNFLIFIVSFLLLKKSKNSNKIFNGFVGLFSIALYAFFRFLVEFYRADFRGNYKYLSISQYISIIVLIICIFTIFKLYKTHQKNRNIDRNIDR